MLYLGCHLSSSKGYATMGKTALSIGANTFQFFTRNPRGLAQQKAPTGGRRHARTDAAGRALGRRGACAVYAEPLLQG